MSFPFNVGNTKWTNLEDIVKILNTITPNTVLIKLPEGGWHEFHACKKGEYEQNTIDVYISENEPNPTMIISPEYLSYCVISKISFFVLKNLNLNSITDQNGEFYETVLLDKKEKTIIEEEVNFSIYQNRADRYINGSLYIFEKHISDNQIDYLIKQFEESI